MAWMRIEEGSSSPQEGQRLRDSPDWLGFGLIAVFVAGVLAMVATWFLVARYPIPDDEAIHLGVLGFLFIILLDLFLIYHLVGPKIRQGRRMLAIKWFVSLVLLGLLVASVVGSLPWLVRRLIDAVPWLPNIFWGLLLLWSVANTIALWRKRRARKASP
jgi:hypothetical protein